MGPDCYSNADEKQESWTLYGKAGKREIPRYNEGGIKAMLS